MYLEKRNKTDHIREMLLKTIGKKPDLFCYYTSLLEARKLLLNSTPDTPPDTPPDVYEPIYVKVITEG